MDQLIIGETLTGDGNSGCRSVNADNFAAVLCDEVTEAAITTAEIQNSEFCRAGLSQVSPPFLGEIPNKRDDIWDGCLCNNTYNCWSFFSSMQLGQLLPRPQNYGAWVHCLGECSPLAGCSISNRPSDGAELAGIRKQKCDRAKTLSH